MRNKDILLLALLGVITISCNFAYQVLHIPSLQVQPIETESLSKAPSPTQLLLPEITPTQPSLTKTIPVDDSTLALQMGFSDSNVKLASSEGASLMATRESRIQGKNYIAFFLSKDFEPRILNDYSTIVLTYEGTGDNVGEFVYRFEIRESIDPDIISDQPEDTDISGKLSLDFPEIIGYEAAGFRLLTSKISEDDYNEYLAVIVSLADLVHILTYQTDPNPAFIETFWLGEIDFSHNDFIDIWKEGIPKDRFRADWFDIEELEKVILPDFQPESLFEKALYAIGCNFYSENGHTEINRTPGYRGIEINYSGNKYILYSCSALLDSASLYDGNSNNMVFIALKNRNKNDLLWTRYGGIINGPITPGDANQDKIPDITIRKTGIAPSAPVDYGFDVLQVTSNGNLIDLLYGIPMQYDNIKSGFHQFEDLNNDEVLEFVKRSAVFYGYDLFAYEQVYILNDDYYYLPPDGGEFDHLCLDALSELPNEVTLSNSEETTDLSEDEELNYRVHNEYYSAIKFALINCDANGVSREKQDEFVALLNTKFPESCDGFLKYLSELDEAYLWEKGKYKSDPNYWSNIFERNGNCKNFTP